MTNPATFALWNDEGTTESSAGRPRLPQPLPRRPQVVVLVVAVVALSVITRVIPVGAGAGGPEGNGTGLVCASIDDTGSCDREQTLWAEQPQGVDHNEDYRFITHGGYDYLAALRGRDSG